MQTIRISYSKTSRGQIRRAVGEHYLRDDIYCGSEACSICPGDAVLSSKPANANALFGEPHYLCIDTSVLFHQMDIVSEDVFTNVIIPQTVVEDIRSKSFSVYKRLRTLLKIAEKRFYVFINEHNTHTYVEQLLNESASDRMCRAIHKVVLFYRQHLLENARTAPPNVVLLTDDNKSRDLAKSNGIESCSLVEYLTGLNRPDLLDKIDLRLDECSPLLEIKCLKAAKVVMFPEHLRLAEIKRKIKLGTLLQGTYHASRDNYLEGTVYVTSGESDDLKNCSQVFIQGYRNQNRAIQDDVVAFEMLPESEWSAPSSLILEEKADEDLGDYMGEQEEEGKLGLQASQKLPSGRIVGIIRRKWRDYCGVLQSDTSPGFSYCLFIPNDRRIPKIRIETRQADRLKNMRIVVTLDGWPRHSRYPHGHYSKTIGELGERGTETEVLLIEHRIPHYPFPPAVLECLPQSEMFLTEEEIAKRVDLRKKLCIISVDPPGCTDIDDALHCKLLKNGNFQCGVHIADVSHFVLPNTALDLEAKNRCTSVYLTEKRIDMLPELLSGNLCSLKENVDRLAFSVIWELTPDAEVVSVEYCKSIIRSRASLEYGEAQVIIEDSSRNDDIAVSLRYLNSLAKILNKRRLENGALTLESLEVRFILDSDTYDPLDVMQKELRDTNRMIEEFMLLANTTVAKHIFDKFPAYACLRRHPAPSISDFSCLIKAAASRGFDLHVDTGKELARSLDEAVLSDHPYFNTMLRMLATRCMTQATYFCSGSLPYAEYRHYGLATDIYTHFTSPIRRYADIVVHRLLACSLGLDMGSADLYDKNALNQLCSVMNERHKQAQYASRDSLNLHTQFYFKDKVCDEEGFIFAILKNALKILVPRFGLEALLYLKNENGEARFEYDEKENTQTCGGVTLRQFDPVIVQISIEKKGNSRQRLCLSLVQPVIPGFSVPPSRTEPTVTDSTQLPTVL